MHALTLPDAAENLSHELPRMAKCVVNRLDKPAAAEQASAEMLLDLLCLSVLLSKSVGVVDWAQGEERRIGSAGVIKMVDAAIAVLQGEAAARFELDHVGFQLLLDAAKKEIAASIAAAPVDTKPQAGPTPSLADSATLLLGALRERDPLTCSHSKAVGEWARRIARGLAMPEDTVSFIELCGVLHDIGKIATPDFILFKREPLTDDERHVMREHPVAGQHILEQVPSLRHCSLVVRAHHEHFDGTGYPDGLAGDAIPTAARIVAVADAFHAMISDRPYHSAMTPLDACDVLRAGAGTHWDPQFVDAVLHLFHREAESYSSRKERVS